MRKLVIYVVVLPVWLLAQGSWVTINSPVTSNLTRCVFVDSVAGWAAGDSGKILFTSDGGASWLHRDIPSKENILNVDFHDRETGWVIVSVTTGGILGCKIYKTTDGGNNWLLLPFSFSDKYFSAIKFIDTITGFAGGQNGTIVQTTDGGLNWSSCTVDSFQKLFYVNEFTFFNNHFGFAYGGWMDAAGIIWHTTNGGSTWKGKNISSEPIRRIHFFDSLNVIAIGGDAEVGVSKYISHDGGLSWTGENLSFAAIPYTISFRTANEAWVPLGFVSNFLVTTDSGRTWKEKIMPENFTIYDFSFPDSLHGYGVGLDGIIVKYMNNPASANDESITDYRIFQNYPNPFNPETVISFSLQHSENVIITVYDLLGNEIKTIADKRFSEGVHQIRFNGVGLTSGVYFYKVKGESFSEIKKMILIR